ncbi:MAG: hypothetical protein WCL21_19570, partial [Mariniphaga sp.]
MNHRIDAEISPASLEKIVQAILVIKTEMPFLIKLDEKEQKSLVRMDDGRLPFVEKSFDLGGRHPVIEPGPGIIEAGKKDLALFTNLTSVKTDLEQLFEMVTDT